MPNILDCKIDATNFANHMPKTELSFPCQYSNLEISFIGSCKKYTLLLDTPILFWLRLPFLKFCLFRDFKFRFFHLMHHKNRTRFSKCFFVERPTTSDS